MKIHHSAVKFPETRILFVGYACLAIDLIGFFQDWWAVYPPNSLRKILILQHNIFANAPACHTRGHTKKVAVSEHHWTMSLVETFAQSPVLPSWQIPSMDRT